MRKKEVVRLIRSFERTCGKVRRGAKVGIQGRTVSVSDRRGTWLFNPRERIWEYVPNVSR